MRLVLAFALVLAIASPAFAADAVVGDPYPLDKCPLSGKALTAEIGEGQKSAALCHLANIALRSGNTVNLDPQTRKIIDDPKAEALATRTYRPGWEPKA